KVVEGEERQFDRVVKTGMIRFEEEIAALKKSPYGQAITEMEAVPLHKRQQHTFGEPSLGITLSGERAFHLYETYGLPLDFMVDAARDVGGDVDVKEFERAKQAEQARARASWKG